MNAHLDRPARSGAVAEGMPRPVRTPARPPHPTHLTQLVARAATGDNRAWDQIVDRFSPLVCRVARTHGLSENDAADVFQATWLNLLEHIGHVQQPDRLAGGLVTTTRREALRVLRHNVRVRPVDEPALNVADPAAQAVALVLLAERDVAVRQAFATLPTDDQALLTLLMADPPLSYQELAGSLDMAIGS